MLTSLEIKVINTTTTIMSRGLHRDINKTLLTSERERAIFKTMRSLNGLASSEGIQNLKEI